jgi:hypothetical protein
MSATLTPNYLVGAAVAVSVAGTEAYVKSGDLTRGVVKITVTNSKSGGYQQLKAGIKSSQLNLECVYNGDAPPTIIEGQEVTVIFDGVGFESGDNLEDGAGGTPTTPGGTLLTGQYLVEIIKDSWVVDGDYSWSLALDSTGSYTVGSATGATPST